MAPGRSHFYVVRIEAVADPTPPKMASSDLAASFSQQFEKVLEQVRGMSERELMDQVYRRLVIHLCGKCFGEWIEDPAGN